MEGPHKYLYDFNIMLGCVILSGSVVYNDATSSKLDFVKSSCSAGEYLSDISVFNNLRVNNIFQLHESM
jgi:hypothetical protein